MKFFLLLSLIVFGHFYSFSQASGTLKGQVRSKGTPVEFVSIGIPGTQLTTTSDLNGYFILKQVPAGSHDLYFSVVGYERAMKKVTITAATETYLEVQLKENPSELNEVVVTGTLKETYTTLSPIKVEVFTPKFFNKSKAATLFENLNMVNGVQPQLNCGVCHTGDIHI